MVDKHRSRTLESVYLGGGVNGVSVGAVGDGVHQVTRAVLVQLPVTQVEIFHFLSHHFGSFRLTIMETKHQRSIFLEIFLKLYNSGRV